ncbi:hypothetical protein DSO57_1008739 [Entomophthora muscae]|uniref:Uncharacterized protein n=1 Tax=Entomophthora muscae TaxID=34485 RepID=A0ACC2THX4_9FUNG|nr:hypothetical protein DSO57_1008739 [Entomophthora muscae]
MSVPALTPLSPTGAPRYSWYPDTIFPLFGGSVLNGLKHALAQEPAPSIATMGSGHQWSQVDDIQPLCFLLILLPSK